MSRKILKIFFIVDGGAKMGLGHVYQSITFAKLLTEIAEICFLTKSGEIVINKISDAGFNVKKLSDDSEIMDYIKRDKPNIVIIDKIDVSESLAKEIKKDGAIKLVIFTNLTDANRYADIAVTADIGSNFKNINFIDDETKTLYFYGPKYWILRKEFHELNKRKKTLSKTVNNILMIFGGSDPSNLTTLVVDELLKTPNDYRLDVIIGGGFGHIDSLNQVLEKYKAADKKISIHKDVPNVAELMYKADVVLASPGLSAFEALYIGTPILVIPQDLLQKETYQDYFKIIDRDEIASKLLVSIDKKDFTYPGEKDIMNMDIAGGTEQLVNLIIGDKNNVD